MELAHALDIAGARSQAVAVTMRRDGRPQLSNVSQHTDGDGIIRVSVTADRAKYHNVRREPWAAIHVNGPDFWSYVVLEGPAEVTPPAAAPDDDVVEELVRLYRDLAGEHPDWDDYRRAMVADDRAVLRVRPERAYGLPPQG
ncbi:PPOX class F420-dependent oxidoreductase [Georgenia deserti]|uniref:PPOX class F420-dependent oxidoreductase n=1 Tax=Georgenia deserti TaxID=2093781 RepID=A0ABW4L7Z1_9MICO